jgi:antibiotic biosynthesis monooxygenase (ABM) superfamily enzyme
MDEFVDARNSAQGDDPPVTAVASRLVKPGSEREFEEWVSGILTAANKFPGYLGSEVLRPSEHDDNEYKIIFRFDHASNLHAWETSEERHHWLRKSRPSCMKRKRSTFSAAWRLGSRYPRSRGNQHHLATRWPSSPGSRSFRS